MIGRGIDARTLENLDRLLPGAPDGRVEIVDLKPQENAITIRPDRRVAHVRMLVGLPGMKLKDERPGWIDELLVLGAAMAARAAEQILVPPAARLHVSNGNQRLGLHRPPPLLTDLPPRQARARRCTGRAGRRC